MGLLDAYNINKAIGAILSAPSGSSAEAIQAVLKLKQIGSPAIPKLIDSLPAATSASVLEGVLVGFVDNTTLPRFAEALAHQDRRVVDSITRVLCQSDRYDPNRMLELFEAPDTSKTALGRIFLAHLDKLNHKELFSLLNRVSSNTRPIIYQLLDKVVSEDDLPILAHRCKTDEPGIRARLAHILGRFSTESSRAALIELLGDPNKNVRIAAMDSLGRLHIPVPSKVIANLLRDPDLAVQAKAIDTLVKIRDAATVKYLIDVLQDDSEYVRRAAVEVLNEVADHRAIKDLLNALRDTDWWVRVRAADALGKIGGPKLVEAVLTLINDEDEFLRRTAVEILNTSKDKRSIDYLIAALDDEDWWVRERAADALIAMGNEHVLQSLRAMLQQESKSTQMAIRALSSLDDKQAIEAIVRHLQSGNEAIRKEAVLALKKLTDRDHVELVQGAMTQLINVTGEHEKHLAETSLDAIAARFGRGSTEQTPSQPVSGIGDDQDEAPMIDLSPITSGPIEFVDTSTLVPGTIVADRYTIIRKVGKGGFGEVFLAEDMVVHDQLILKFLNPHLAENTEMIQRFIQELRYARKITHENVIRIYDFITFGKSCAISMEYFPGHSLADELAPKAPIPLERGVRLVLDICSGMAAAQAVDVVHRDLKPANILINDNDTVKIVDFGLAAAATRADAHLTRSGLLIGTPTYMSPERARGKAIDSRTDIYSLGIIMYEMFTGKPPYTGDDPMAVLLQHVEGTASSPDEINPKIPTQLTDIILKAMALDPQQRHQNFDELRHDLETLDLEAH